jgi:hypothetical protein
MGTATSKEPKTRRFSRLTSFTHWMDNMSDKKSIKIKMTRRPSEGFDGVFTLWYQDDSNDEFMNIKSSFTFSGNYAPDTEAGSIKFTTHELICKLSEDGHGFSWRITPTDKPDCSINQTSGVISWPWDPYDPLASKSPPTTVLSVSTGQNSATGTTAAAATASGESGDDDAAPSSLSTPRKSTLFRGYSKLIEHTCPLGSLDFSGEDNPETGGFVLRLRIPQLAAGWNPAVVALNPMSGWELSKQKSILGGAST